MTESERVAKLETRIDSLEIRMDKVEDSVEQRGITLSEIDTKLQLLSQKFDTFLDSLKVKDDDKKFNWTTVIAVLAILIALAGTVWGNYYVVNKTLEATSGNIIQLSDEDLNKIRNSVVVP